MILTLRLIGTSGWAHIELNKDSQCLLLKFKSAIFACAMALCFDPHLTSPHVLCRLGVPRKIKPHGLCGFGVMLKVSTTRAMLGSYGCYPSIELKKMKGLSIYLSIHPKST